MAWAWRERQQGCRSDRKGQADLRQGELGGLQVPESFSQPKSLDAPGVRAQPSCQVCRLPHSPQHQRTPGLVLPSRPSTQPAAPPSRAAARTSAALSGTGASSPDGEQRRGTALREASPS